MTSEKPVGVPGNQLPGWGSDTVALALRNLDIPYIALNPGASYRGFHDSLVNFLGNETPKMILCLHEGNAVAIAHGYAKVTGKPMAVALHSNVGLMHGTMGIFNAFCDRMPMMIFGATGPVDAAKRRPWIDWIHTARDQGALIRNYTKWDDQPASPQAAVESVYRANLLTRTAPCGPVYINLDVTLQEEALAKPVIPPDIARYKPAAPARPSAASIKEAVAALKRARKPLILCGRSSVRKEDWDRRVQLAERLGAGVISDHKGGASFPTDHPLSVRPPMTFPQDEDAAVIREADVILNLDWNDFAGVIRHVWKDGQPTATIIQASVDQYAHNGWSMDYQGLVPVDIQLLSDPDTAVADLLAELPAGSAPALPPKPAAKAAAKPVEGPLTNAHIGQALRDAVSQDQLVTFSRMPNDWSDIWPMRHPLDYLGIDGGGGIGSGPGIAIGTGLALKGSDRMVVMVGGDGDFLMSANAMWTAAHYEIPVLFVISNNRSYFNDEMHQDRVARMRNREPANRWIGQRISDPDVDIAKLAEAQGVRGLGPIEDYASLQKAIKDAVAMVKGGKPAVVDVRVALRDPTKATHLGHRSG